VGVQPCGTGCCASSGWWLESARRVRRLLLAASRSSLPCRSLLTDSDWGPECAATEYFNTPVFPDLVGGSSETGVYTIFELPLSDVTLNVTVYVFYSFDLLSPLFSHLLFSTVSDNGNFTILPAANLTWTSTSLEYSQSLTLRPLFTLSQLLLQTTPLVLTLTYGLTGTDAASYQTPSPTLVTWLPARIIKVPYRFQPIVPGADPTLNLCATPLPPNSLAPVFITEQVTALSLPPVDVTLTPQPLNPLFSLPAAQGGLGVLHFLPSSLTFTHNSASTNLSLWALASLEVGVTSLHSPTNNRFTHNANNYTSGVDVQWVVTGRDAASYVVVNDDAALSGSGSENRTRSVVPVMCEAGFNDTGSPPNQCTG
jgi:hypothetical protein